MSKEKEEAVDAVIEALWKMMHEATINFMSSPLEKNKAELKRALYKMMESREK
jgi:hypothetical protein